MSSKIFDPQYWNLETVFKQIYNVPVYQRPYSWDKEQIDVLLDDLFNSYKEDKNAGYYIGNVIVYDNGEKINGNILKFELVDGQQRLTTFTLILLAIYCLTLKKGYSTTDTTIQNVKGCLWKYINRKYSKDLHTVYLNSIEKNAFSDLYDYCFTAENNEFDIKNYCDTYKKNNKFEERVFANFKNIYDYLENVVCENGKNEEILYFADYILQSAQFIVIESTCKPNKVFSMFESINSKGKKLDEIDLIKTYIFSNLEPEVYDTYLNIWGNLIIETKDNLYDYLYNFIKAYICFYRQNISIVNFKSICKHELLAYYHEFSLSEALKLFLNDLNSKVKFYNMLSSAEDADKLINNTCFRFYFKVFTEIGYKHPKPLFLRTLYEYSEGKFEKKDDAVEIFVETIKFMLKFLTISGRDSKDAITMFSAIMNDVYSYGCVSKDIVNNAIVAELLKQGVTNEKLKDDLQSIDAYEQNKKLTIALLALYDSSAKNKNGKIKVSYDQAYIVIKNYSLAFSLDHLLVQSPDESSDEYKYYCDETNNKLVLKDGNDFPNDIIVNGMDYEMFTKIILNKIGNLRIYYKDKNSRRQNASISLAEYPDFYTYSKVIERGNTIANLLIDEILKAPKVDVSKIQMNPLKKSEEALPKMDELMAAGLVKKGDELYITIRPDDSKAILEDSKYVIFNGERMTLNNWGCKVTGWKSIRIYAYAAIVGEIETLHQKRLAFANEHNEESVN